MKNKLNLISSVIQLVFGVLAIVSFVILSISGENMIQWIITLALAITFVIIGVIGIINYKNQ